MTLSLRILAHPLVAVSVALALAGSWAFSYTSANHQARLAAEKIKPWNVLARAQLADVNACEDRARSLAQAKYPNEHDLTDREIEARLKAYECAADYLLAQPVASPVAASQVLGYAAGVAERKAALDLTYAPPPNYEALFAKASKDARAATKQAQEADQALLAACDGFLAAAACSIAQLTPDRPDRRLGDGMREFEVDVHAQHLTTLHAKAQGPQRAENREMDARESPAYAQARTLVYALH
jgi:hypothetical protein